MKATTIFIWSCIIQMTVFAQCNGTFSNCDKQYNQIAYLTTHNSYNSISEGFAWENQNYGITQQLNDGVRAFMFDVYNLNDTIVQYHGFFQLGYQPIRQDLTEIKDFLYSHPNEVVSIILESYVNSSDIENELDSAGLMPFLFSYSSGTGWPTLQEMINNNERLVLFSDVDDGTIGQTWYHYVWQHAVETHFSVSDTSEFTNNFNRGNPSNDLFIFNHFVTHPTLGIGEPTKAPYVNEYNYLLDRIESNFSEHSKFPNFITLDFYDLGDGLDVVSTLNQISLSTENKSTQAITIHPNPSKGLINLIGNGHEIHEFILRDITGTFIHKEIIQINNQAIYLGHLPLGMYLYEISNSQGYYSTGKLILN